MKVEYHARPACRYLAVSVLLGSGLNVWFFVDNRTQVVGEAFVLWGVPVGLCVGLLAGVAWHYAACARRGKNSEPSGAGELHADVPQLGMGDLDAAAVEVELHEVGGKGGGNNGDDGGDADVIRRMVDDDCDATVIRKVVQA